MCTVSWLRTAEGYEVFCNRDERHTRGLAAPPRMREREGIRYVAPVDTDAGGTWIATNDAGVTLVLLNSPGSAPQRSISRGLLVLRLIAAASIGAAETCLRTMSLDTYAPFQLAALDLEDEPRVFAWTGARLITAADAARSFPLTSSSFDSEEVCERRRHLFQSMATQQDRIDRSLLLRFHAGHDQTPDAYSTCMHRQDAATVSFSHIVVSPGGSRFFYKAGPLCRPGPMYTALLTPPNYDPLFISPRTGYLRQ